MDQQKAYTPKDLLKRPNVAGFEKRMNSKDLHTLFKLGKFCKEILVTVKVIYSRVYTLKNFKRTRSELQVFY